MISNELLSKVLNRDIFNVEKIPTEINIYYAYWVNNQEYSDDINIYELAHKCKEWCGRETKYIIWSELNNSRVSNMFDLQGKDDKWFKADTEPEAIFKACEWILNQKAKELRTSKEWYDDQDDVVLMDPDGWDRSNYEYSFNEEKITKEEFKRRLAYSTCRFNRT